MPSDVDVVHEGRKHYVDTAGACVEIFTASALRRRGVRHNEVALVDSEVDVASGAVGIMVEERESGGGNIKKPQRKNPNRAGLAGSFPDLAPLEKRVKGDRSPSFFSPSAGDAWVTPAFDGEDPLALLCVAAATMS